MLSVLKVSVAVYHECSLLGLSMRKSTRHSCKHYLQSETSPIEVAKKIHVGPLKGSYNSIFIQVNVIL